MMCPDTVMYADVMFAVTSAGSLRAVRHDVREQMGRWGLGRLADDAVLVVGELSVNALGHGRGPVGVALALRERAGHPVLRIQVTDAGHGFDADLVRAHWRHPSFAFGEGGRGLLLIDALTGEWGHRHDSTGHTVWAVLSSGTTV
ncbi:ATP-binding protein [Streptomyces sp. NPDC093094]|uniref:ATP-binding protein n=1 Tax=Streptomyces sp. NPDC093094 TaxID=3366026 RepID=UPI0037F376BB